MSSHTDSARLPAAAGSELQTLAKTIIAAFREVATIIPVRARQACNPTADGTFYGLADAGAVCRHAGGTIWSWVVNALFAVRALDAC